MTSLSLNDWSKPDKCPMTVTIIDTEPKETKMENLKDFLMIFLWTRLEDQVTGDPMSFSRLTEVTISEIKQDFELILPRAIIEILMTNPEGTYTTLNCTQVTYTLSVSDPKNGKKPAHIPTEHFLHAYRQRGYKESPPSQIVLNVFTRALAPLGMKILKADAQYSKTTMVPTLMGKYHVGFDLSNYPRERTLTEFSKIKTITVVDVPFDIKLSRDFCALACLCGDCYTWIRWPDPTQTASFNNQVYTYCTQCAKKKLVEETHPKQNPADKKRAAERFLQDALKKLAKKA